MSFLSIVFLAFAMSADAFAAALGKGAALHRPSWREAVRTGLIFGIIEACTPVIGWVAGAVAADHLAQWDHWIAVSLLGVLGLRMIREGLTKSDAREKAIRHSFWVLVVTGFATSIDAMAVGVGLAFLDVDILRVAAAIGLATLTMVTLGVMLGRVVGTVIGKRAEVAGGIILIGIGLLILQRHLQGLA